MKSQQPKQRRLIYFALMANIEFLMYVISPTESFAAKPLLAYVGTLSSPHTADAKSPPANHGRGIHCFEVDRSTGELAPHGMVELGNSPSCLTIDRERNCIFSANETDHIAPSGEGSVTAYTLDAASGLPKLLNTVRSGGVGPTHISLHPSGRFLLVANYVGGSVAVLPISSDGKLSEPVDVKVDKGAVGPKHAQNAPRGTFALSGHDHPHAHMIQASPKGNFVLHSDLGLDSIFTWRIDGATGKLAPADNSPISLPPGDGPRHFCFHPRKASLYSIQEEGSTITRFDFDEGTGKLAPRQTISTLSPGFCGSSFASTVMLSPNGKFLYAGNRLHDSVAVFSIDESGNLSFAREVWTEGSYPSSFNFDPSGAFLFCCNQNSDNVTVFRVNSKTGDLEFTGHSTPVGNPMSIVFWSEADRY